MMSFRNLWQNRKKPTISFEFFPPRDEKGADKLDKVIEGLAELEPDFVSVTFGAGGSTREGSYQLVKKLREERGLRVLPYLAAYGLSPSEVDGIVSAYRNLGTDAIFAIRGDQPEDAGITAHPEGFPHASDLIAYLRGRFPLIMGCAAYPEGHVDAESKEKDLERLKFKVEQGAHFIITQYVYDTRMFLDFRRRCRDMGITIPILAGIMPVYSIKMTENLAAMCGATIPPHMAAALRQLPPEDKDAAAEYGIELAVEMCRELLKHDIDGFHFYTMDRAKSVAAILSRLSHEGLL